MTPSSERFSPPQSEVSDITTSINGEPASRAQRFVNFLIDYVAFMALSFVVGLLIAMVGGDAGIRAIRSVPDLLFGSVLMLTYYIGFEAAFGRTFGKLVTGTRVVDDAGHPPSFLRVVGRSLARFVPFEALTFFGERGVHDRWSGTRVIRSR